MERFLLFLLVCVAEAVPLKNLEEQVFLFPKRSTQSYVVLKRCKNQEMTSFTLCLRIYYDLQQEFALFSAATADQDNELLFFKKATGYEVTLGGHVVFFKAPKEKSSSQGEDLCVAWDSATGIVQFWLNRIPLPRKVFAKGYRIRQDLSIMLGQDQDSYGGSLDAGQAFEGELGEVYLWDTVLSATQMRSFHRREGSTPLVDWFDLSYEIKGEVMVVPSFF